MPARGHATAAGWSSFRQVSSQPTLASNPNPPVLLAVASPIDHLKNTVALYTAVAVLVLLGLFAVYLSMKVPTLQDDQ